MTVAFAMLADYAVSMSVTPVMLARLYQRGHGNGSDEDGSAGEGWFRYVLASMSRCSERPSDSKSS